MNEIWCAGYPEIAYYQAEIKSFWVLLAKTVQKFKHFAATAQSNVFLVYKTQEN